ncbi:glutamyl-tRNA amidotransferase [Streptococcus mitis]|uniref:glutamyl-tRNA amidotransferase n=1 Tax=Streptococcus mitis TaxID=28037 RepID=UPI00398BDE30
MSSLVWRFFNILRYWAVTYVTLKKALPLGVYVEKAGMVQISDPAVLIPIIHQVFADNEAAVADFKSGKRNADKAFTGFLMKATKGQANPQVALKLLAQELAKLKEE